MGDRKAPTPPPADAVKPPPPPAPPERWRPGRVRIAGGFARRQPPKVVAMVQAHNGPIVVLDTGAAYMLNGVIGDATWHELPPVPGTEAAEREGGAE